MEDETLNKVEEDLLAEKLASIIGNTPIQDEKQNVHYSEDLKTLPL